jgi:hypothetical protein
LQLLTTVAPLSAPALSLDTGAVIPGTLTHLVIVMHARSAAAAAGDTVTIQLNGDTGNNYSWITLSGNGTTAASGTGSAIQWGRVGYIPGANQAAGTFGQGILVISRYASTIAVKSGTMYSGAGSGLTPFGLGMGTFSWASAAAINRVQLLCISAANMDTGSAMYVYGL